MSSGTVKLRFGLFGNELCHRGSSGSSGIVRSRFVLCPGDVFRCGSSGSSGNVKSRAGFVRGNGFNDGLSSIGSSHADFPLTGLSLVDSSEAGSTEDTPVLNGRVGVVKFRTSPGLLSKAGKALSLPRALNMRLYSSPWVGLGLYQ